MFRLNPNAASFIPRNARLVRQNAVPSRKVSFSPTLVTEEKVFLFTEGSEARSNPTGKSRLMKINYKRLDSKKEKLRLEEARKSAVGGEWKKAAGTGAARTVAPNVCDDWFTVMGTTETEDLY